MQSPRFCWELPAHIDEPKSPMQDDFAPWFALQDPAACSEKDRVLMTNHFVEHLVKKSTQCWPAQPATALHTLKKDPKIQESLDDWIHAWQWTQPPAFYTSMVRDNLWHPRASDWVEKSFLWSTQATFGLQLAMVLENEYQCLKSIQDKQNNWSILCRTGYTPAQQPAGGMLRHYLHQWETRYKEEGLLACLEVLEMLHPRPSASTHAESIEACNAVFRGLVEHRQHGMFRTASLQLPSDVLEPT